MRFFRVTRIYRRKPAHSFGLFDIVMIGVIALLVMAFLEGGGAAYLPFVEGG